MNSFKKEMLMNSFCHFAANLKRACLKYVENTKINALLWLLFASHLFVLHPKKHKYKWDINICSYWIKLHFVFNVLYKINR